MNHKSITAIVTTFNRKQLLLQCLRNLKNQTHQPDHILIVNNASTDGSMELLYDKGWLSREGIRVISLPQNIGGAGAFAEGMRMAAESGADLLWLMDDDGYPTPNCLELLFQRLLTDKLDAISPIHADVNHFHLPAFPLFDTHNRLIKKLPYFPPSGDPLIMQQANLFNGMLIRTQTVATIGYPRAELFIRGDEVDYLRRMNKAKSVFGTLSTATFFHPSDRKERIRFLGGLAWARDAYSDFKNYYMYRNKALAFRENGLLWLLPIDALRYVLYFVVHKRGDFHGLGLWARAVHDGLRKRLGRHPDY